MFKLIVGLLLMQYNADPIRTAEQAPLVVEARSRALANVNRRQREWQRHSFEEKFNALVKAAGAFASQYNKSDGDVWPQKEAKALSKALVDLQGVPELKRHTSPGS